MNQLGHIHKDDEGRIIRSKMPKLRRPSKDTVGWFNPDGRCKKHPKHRQSPGVCSLCLREKLTQIPSSSSSSHKATSAASSTSSSSSLSSYYSSSSASSCASPMHRFRFTTEGKCSSSISIFLLGVGLPKSMSLAALPRRRHHAAAKDNDLVDNNDIKSAKKGGFWSKLLNPNKGKRKEEVELMHSRSVKERVTVAS